MDLLSGVSFKELFAPLWGPPAVGVLSVKPFALGQDLSTLPPEILVHIFRFLTSPQDLCSLSRVNRLFNELSSSTCLWKPLCPPDWEDKKTCSTTWKAEYLDFLRTAIKSYSLGRKDKVSARSNWPLKSSADPQYPYDFLMKILVLGHSCVGKSSIIQRYTDNTFSSPYFTIGVDFRFRAIEVNGKRGKLQIWDTAGPERFRNITSFYYRGAHGILLVYDVSNRQSFDHVKCWNEEIRNHTNEFVTVALVGNKTDLSDSGQRVVEREEGEELANELDIPLFAETSAKTGEGVEAAFGSLVENVLMLGGVPIKSGKEGYWDRCVRAAAQKKKGVPKVLPSVEELEKLGIMCCYTEEDKKQSNCVCS